MPTTLLLAHPDLKTQRHLCKGIAEVVSLYVKTLARIVESILDKLGMNEETEFAQNAKH